MLLDVHGLPHHTLCRLTILTPVLGALMHPTYRLRPGQLTHCEKLFFDGLNKGVQPRLTACAMLGFQARLQPGLRLQDKQR